MNKPLAPQAAARVIPDHWTPGQALWALYGPQIQQAWAAQLVPAAPRPHMDPDAPF